MNSEEDQIDKHVNGTNPTSTKDTCLDHSSVSLPQVSAQAEQEEEKGGQRENTPKMVTRSKAGVFKPKVFGASLEPTSVVVLYKRSSGRQR